MDTQTVVLPSSGKKCRIPVGKDGYVPDTVLLKHLYTRGSPNNDYEQKADVVLPSKLTPRQVAPWWEDPDKYDIESIDVKGKPLNNPGGRKGDNRAVHKKVHIYAAPSEERKIRKVFDSSFSLAERKKMVAKNDVNIEVRPMAGKIAGEYRGKSDIDLRRYKGDNNSIMLHEGTHLLRSEDDDRKNKITTSASKLDIPRRGSSKNAEKVRSRSMMNIEESCTVAEQMARAKTNAGSGYYKEVPVFDNKTRRWRKPTLAEVTKMQTEDRKLFTNGKNKPLAEKAAIESVNKNWASSHIARLKTAKSRRMAINDMAAIDKNIKPVTAKQTRRNKNGNKN